MEFHKIGRHKGTALSVFREEYSDQVSKDVHESIAHREIPPEAQISERVVLQETSRSIQTFKLTYDKIFKKFQERLIEQYSGMRGGYMSEY